MNETDDLLDLDFRDLYAQKKAVKKQGGIGYHSLCEKCNNETGSWYGHAFVDYAYQAMGILQKAKGTPSLYYPTFFYPLRVIKQVITMFFSVNSELFRTEEHELVKFIKNKEERYLPKKYKVYSYYNIEGRMRYIGYSVVGQITPGSIHHLSEITFPPFGFVLAINSGSPDKRLTDISHFSHFRYEQWTEYYQRFNTLPTHFPNFPADYRSKTEIVKGIAEAKIAASRLKKNSI